MKKPFKETRFGKFLSGAGKVAAPLLEGTAQSVPGGNLVIKIGTAILKSLKIIKPQIKDANGNMIPAPAPNWFALGVEGILVAAIVYSFITKAITLDDMIEYLNKFLPE